MTTAKKFIQQERQLIAWSIFGCLLILGRVIWRSNDLWEWSLYHPNWLFVFLIWNLFLAWMPIFIGRKLSQVSAKNPVFYLLLILWLLFFPNAPYLVTDLIHLRARPIIPIWYDSLILFVFAALGLWLAIRSLLQIRTVILKSSPVLWADTWIYGSLLLSGLGVYLGRVLRWNSWDIFVNPVALFVDVFELIIHPIANKSAWLMIIVFSSFMSFLYWTVKSTAFRRADLD